LFTLFIFYFLFTFLLFYLERRTTEPSRSLSAIADFLVIYPTYFPGDQSRLGAIVSTRFSAAGCLPRHPTYSVKELKELGRGPN